MFIYFDASLLRMEKELDKKTLLVLSVVLVLVLIGGQIVVSSSLVENSTGSAGALTGSLNNDIVVSEGGSPEAEGSVAVFVLPAEGA